jgi:hypothetical protein
MHRTRKRGDLIESQRHLIWNSNSQPVRQSHRPVGTVNPELLIVRGEKDCGDLRRRASYLFPASFLFIGCVLRWPERGGHIWERYVTGLDSGGLGPVCVFGFIGIAPGRWTERWDDPSNWLALQAWCFIMLVRFALKATLSVFQRTLFFIRAKLE